MERDIDREELVARIHAIVRRSRGFSDSALQVGEFTLDVAQQDVVARGTRVHLTGKEFALLQLLVLRRNMILTKETMLSHLYGGRDEPEIKIIDVFICKIRGKLASAGLPSLITTVWGRGYTVKDARPDRITSTPLPASSREQELCAWTYARRMADQYGATWATASRRSYHRRRSPLSKSA